MTSARAATIAVGALVDHESSRLHRNLIGAKQIENVERAAFCHGRRVKAALPWHETKIETANTRRRRMQDSEAVPVLLDHAERQGGLSREREDRPPVLAGKRALTDQDDRL